ncbi:MAG: hypothetical protein ABSH17_07560, partial [Syntrophobacteraceae bacterium]
NVLKIVDGYSKVEMKFHPDMENLFGKAHGNPCGGAQDATTTQRRARAWRAMGRHGDKTVSPSPRLCSDG